MHVRFVWLKTSRCLEIRADAYLFGSYFGRMKIKKNPQIHIYKQDQSHTIWNQWFSTKFTAYSKLIPKRKKQPSAFPFDKHMDTVANIKTLFALKRYFHKICMRFTKTESGKRILG